MGSSAVKPSKVGRPSSGFGTSSPTSSTVRLNLHLAQQDCVQLSNSLQKNLRLRPGSSDMATDVNADSIGTCPDGGNRELVNQMEVDENADRPLFCGLREEWERLEKHDFNPPDGQSLADVVIVCRDQKRIRSHRMVLASLSPMIWRALITDPIKEEESVLIVPDVDSGDLAEFLRKAYSGGEDEVVISPNIRFLGFNLEITEIPQFKVEFDEYENEKSDGRHEMNLVNSPRSVPSLPASSYEQDSMNYISMQGRSELELEQENENDPLNLRLFATLNDFFKVTPKNKFVTCLKCRKRFKNFPNINMTLIRHLKLRHDKLYQEYIVSKNEDVNKPSSPETILPTRDEEGDEMMARTKIDQGFLVNKYFEFQNDNTAKCLVSKCGTVVETSDENMDPLSQHLQVSHPKEFSALKEEDLNEEDSDDVVVHLGKTRESTSSKKDKERVVLGFYDESLKGTVMCKACSKNISYKPGSASNLVRHLHQAHERLYQKYLIESDLDETAANDMRRSRKSGSSKKVNREQDDPANRTCPDCGKIYSKRKGMLVHLEAVHSGKRPFVCDECGMSFARKESFKRHTHDNFRPFLCSVCGKTFARRHIRDIHERAHYGDKRYPCNYCEKKFVTNQKKTIHERIHTGEKPFECKVCGKKFVQKHQLQTHTRIHTGARPYRCNHCNQMFRHLSTRAKHNCPGKPKEVNRPSQGQRTSLQELNELQQQQQRTELLNVYDNESKETIII